jgi:hypothetical protein
VSQYLEVLFRVSIHGFNSYEASSITRSLADRPMDEINNFIFWRDFIFSHLSPYLIGTKALEAYLSNTNASGSFGRDQFPGPSPSPSRLFNPSRSLFFPMLTFSFFLPVRLLPRISSTSSDSALATCSKPPFLSLSPLCYCSSFHSMHHRDLASRSSIL